MMLKILKAYGISLQIIQAISWLFEDTRAKVLTRRETEYFNILVGVLQRDKIAPLIKTIHVK